MSDIQSIIEEATKNEWIGSPSLDTFNATFDPEHVALMEAVCRASRKMWDDYAAVRACASWNWLDEIAKSDLIPALRELATYRKEEEEL